MPAPEVQNPIINRPFEEPKQYWLIHEHEEAEKKDGRRPPTYRYLPPNAKATDNAGGYAGEELPLENVALIRDRLAEWRPLALRGEGGVSRVTMELLNHWWRDGRQQPLFFAQLEAAETIIFLTEARADFLQGIDIPTDEPGEEKLKDGYTAFHRRCCKMATGAGKTTVMAMLAAWSILNKVNNRTDKRFSDAVLVVCPNVTIRERLAELDPQKDEASIYRTRDLVPHAMMPDLAQGRVLTVNWHVFEPHGTQSGGKVVKTGRRLLVHETVSIGDKNDTVRGRRYLTIDTLRTQQALGLITVLNEITDKDGTLKKVEIESEKYIETDAAIVRRVLGSDLGARSNILVFNDEAHHAYRLHPKEDDKLDVFDDALGDTELTEHYYREATVWVDGLDRVHKNRSINFCVDFSATPYFLGKAGKNTNRVFPWTVSDFGLQDAIESGLVKIPQLATRDGSGAEVPGYFNIWKWIREKLTPAESGGKRGDVKPEAILKYAHTPIAMMGSLWDQERERLEKTDDKRPPVFILVCKTQILAGVVFDWLADDKPPNTAIASANLPELRNTDEKQNTIIVHSNLEKALESDNAKSDDDRWMRYTLDTIGKQDWLRDTQQRAQYPEGFEELAEKLGREKHPPGRDVRCIVSVGMLTEGWDCSTVTHIIGLRPFMSQLLCEQVIGRGLRRASYEVNSDGLMSEEIATVLGVPLSTFTVKGGGGTKERAERNHVYALPAREAYKITFPRVEGYRQTIRRQLTCDMEKIPPVEINSAKIPPELEMKAGLATNQGLPSLHGPGKITDVSLQEYRKKFRFQQKLYEMTLALTKDYSSDDECQLPAELLFGQLYQIVHDYITQKVTAIPPSDTKDAFLSPYYGSIIENLRQHLRPDTDAGETPELPRYEQLRSDGSTADVDFYTTRKLYPVMKSHINAVVPDTKKLEQKAARRLDTNPQVIAFAKNEGMGFGIPYIYNGEMHDYMPDFLIRLNEEKTQHLILETKGYDELKEIKEGAARRWVDAVNADGKYGQWDYRMVSEDTQVDSVINDVIAEMNE